MDDPCQSLKFCLKCSSQYDELFKHHFVLVFISDDVKQLAQEVCDSIRNDMGTQNFVQVYSQIRKNLKAKRDKRRQEEKVMAVVNPERNAKRKLRNAAKHRANKKRKIMTMKMGRWLH